MGTTEQDVARHYTHGALEDAILGGLAALGQAAAADAVEQLAAVDEFHIGGREATAEIADRLRLQPGLRVLDVGCGIGGAARFLASRYGCRVTGIDLTAEYVDVGNRLNGRLGLADRIDLRVASATEMPFEDASFDRAVLLHVGMNIPDKRGLFAEIQRVLAPGGILAAYDVMRTGAGALLYPVPWARTEATSFVEAPGEYRSAIEAAGLAIVSERNRREFALAFFQRMKARAAQGGPPPLGLHIMMVEDAPAKVANMIANLERALIAPVEMIARRP